MRPDLKRELFFMVWSPRGHAPTYKHGSQRSAEDEAHRLARLSPGEEFYVLQCLSGFMIEQPKVIALDIDPEYIPF